MEIKLSHKKCPRLEEIFFLHRESGLKPSRNVHPLRNGDSHTCCCNTGSTSIHSTIVPGAGQIPNKVLYQRGCSLIKDTNTQHTATAFVAMTEGTTSDVLGLPLLKYRAEP